MLFNNPIFAGWYTDTVDIYRTVPETSGAVTVQARKKVNETPIPCRLYEPQKAPVSMTDNAARVRAEGKLACDLGVDICAGDELLVVRGGNLGHANQAQRYFAGIPQKYYDPVGGVLSGLQHQEVGLLMDEIVR